MFVLIIVVVCVLAALWSESTEIKNWSTFSLALITVISAFVEWWCGDVTKEAIDRVPDNDKSADNDKCADNDKSADNDVSWIPRQREWALLAKAIKFLAAFATVAVAVLF